ncbi:MAG: type I restriction-modification enzyme R subunit C-terminal domain-containing protein [Verrucomicrobiota bacterium]
MDAFDQPPLTRRERAENVRKRDFFTKYGPGAARVLSGLLDRYADQVLLDLEDRTVLHQPLFNEIGTPLQIADLFGGPNECKQVIRELVTVTKTLLDLHVQQVCLRLLSPYHSHAG